MASTASGPAPPYGPPRDNYESNYSHLVTPHFEPTPQLVPVQDAYTKYGNHYQAEKWRPMAIQATLTAQRLYRLNNISYDCDHTKCGLYIAGTENDMQNTERDRMMVLVFELARAETSRWRDLHDGAKDMLAALRLDGVAGVCIRYYVKPVNTPTPLLSEAERVAVRQIRDAPRPRGMAAARPAIGRAPRLGPSQVPAASANRISQDTYERYETNYQAWAARRREQGLPIDEVPESSQSSGFRFGVPRGGQVHATGRLASMTSGAAESASSDRGRSSQAATSTHRSDTGAGVPRPHATAPHQTYPAVQAVVAPLSESQRQASLDQEDESTWAARRSFYRSSPFPQIDALPRTEPYWNRRDPQPLTSTSAAAVSSLDRVELGQRQVWSNDLDQDQDDGLINESETERSEPRARARALQRARDQIQAMHDRVERSAADGADNAEAVSAAEAAEALASLLRLEEREIAHTSAQHPPPYSRLERDEGYSSPGQRSGSLSDRPPGTSSARTSATSRQDSGVMSSLSVILGFYDGLVRQQREAENDGYGTDDSTLGSDDNKDEPSRWPWPPQPEQPPPALDYRPRPTLWY